MEKRNNMRAVLLATLLVLISSLTAAVSCSIKSTSRHNAPATPFEASLDSLFSTLISPNEPGALIMVTQCDTLIYNKGFGVARLDSKDPIDENTLFNISTTSKFFTAVGIMKLVEEGLLNLDDPLSKHFDNLRNSIFDRITLRHVLSGSTGLPTTLPSTHEEWHEYVKTHTSIFGHNRDFLLYGDDAELSRYLESIDTLLYEPGTDFATGMVVTDPPYMLLSKLVENLTHQDYSDWMLENIVRVDSIGQAAYTDYEVEKTPHMSHAYTAASNVPDVKKRFSDGNKEWAEYDYGEAPFFLSKSDNGLFISGLSYAKWRHVLLSGDIITLASLDTIYTPIVYRPENPLLSHGLGVITSFKNGHDKPKYYMCGRNGGYATAIVRFPATSMSYILMMNRSDIDLDKLMDDIDRILRQYNYI